VTEYAYTDADARDEELRAAAVEYVLGYPGSFAPIVRCKDRLALGYALETAHVRVVLNTMRSDPRVTGMPAPLGGDVIDLSSRRKSFIDFDEGAEEKVAPKRKVSLRLPMTVKRSYGTSWTRNATKIHVVNGPSSYMEWTAARSPFNVYEWDWNSPRVAEPKIHYHCSLYAKSTKLMQLLTIEQAQDLVRKGERTWCRWCVEKETS
jgi:hypothetical protein